MNDHQSVIRVQLFAGAAAATGRQFVELTPDSGDTQASVKNSLTVADIRTELVRQYPQLVALEKLSRFAIGTQFVDDDTPLNEETCLVMIPPVSGG